MLRPERSKLLLGVHKCLGSKRPMFCPELNKILLGVHKCLGSRRPMLCPERSKILLGFHKCLGSKRPMLCPEHNKFRLSLRKSLGPQGAMLSSERQGNQQGFRKGFKHCTREHMSWIGDTEHDVTTRINTRLFFRAASPELHGTSTLHRRHLCANYERRCKRKLK